MRRFPTESSMISLRPASRVLRPIVAGIAVAALLSLASCSSSVTTSNARADETKESEKETDPEFIVPDGTPEEILAFVKKLQTTQKKFANRQEFIDTAIRTNKAFIAAGDKLLSMKIDDKVAAQAAQMKLMSMANLGANGIEDYAKQSLEADKQ
jgi:hypothetical protein